MITFGFCQCGFSLVIDSFKLIHLSLFCFILLFHFHACLSHFLSLHQFLLVIAVTSAGSRDDGPLCSNLLPFWRPVKPAGCHSLAVKYYELVMLLCLMGISFSSEAVSLKESCCFLKVSKKAEWDKEGEDEWIQEAFKKRMKTAPIPWWGLAID